MSSPKTLNRKVKSKHDGMAKWKVSREKTAEVTHSAESGYENHYREIARRIGICSTCCLPSRPQGVYSGGQNVMQYVAYYYCACDQICEE